MKKLRMVKVDEFQIFPSKIKANDFVKYKRMKSYINNSNTKFEINENLLEWYIKQN